MAVSKQFVDHAIDLLSGLGAVQARPMFGGYGVYFKGVIFALLDDDEIFVKVDDASRQRFVGAGCRQWVYQSSKGPMAGGYFRPPDDAMEDAESMLPWALLGVEASARARAAKAAKSKKGRAAKKPAKRKQKK